MTYQTPCSSPENDPDDWFISKDGRQYPDEPLVSIQDAVDHLDEIDPNGTRYEALIVRVREDLEEKATKAALVRRRHAKDACFVDCLVRAKCLSVALETRPAAGTWGGYHEEELREIQSEISRRKRNRAR